MFRTQLQVQIVDAGRETRDIQSKIHKRKAPLARVKCAHERDNGAFGELIEQLRKAGGVSRQVPRRARSNSHLGSSQLRSTTPKTASIFSLRPSATTYSALSSQSPTSKTSAHGARAEQCPVWVAAIGLVRLQCPLPALTWRKRRTSTWIHTWIRATGTVDGVTLGTSHPERPHTDPIHVSYPICYRPSLSLLSFSPPHPLTLPRSLQQRPYDVPVSADASHSSPMTGFTNYPPCSVASLQKYLPVSEVEYIYTQAGLCGEHLTRTLPMTCFSLHIHWPVR